jgi:RNA polymerase sigma factor (sigma-70 family)
MLDPRATLLYHFGRLQLPGVVLAPDRFDYHLKRTFDLYRAKTRPDLTPAEYIDTLYAVDWFLGCACIEGDERAWERFFGLRTGRTDCLLIDALRARAARLFPRNEEKQESAVDEFWSQLLVSERPGVTPVLGRYDGQRPLVPWLIRVFQNQHVRPAAADKHLSLPEDDLSPPLPERAEERWHEEFRLAARDWLGELGDDELLLLGLRFRYRLSQREAAQVLGMHEGNLSRRTDKLRERCLERIGGQLRERGWSGDDLAEFVQAEMGSLLLDDPRLSADQLARLLAARGKAIPAIDHHPG